MIRAIPAGCEAAPWPLGPAALAEDRFGRSVDLTPRQPKSLQSNVDRLDRTVDADPNVWIRGPVEARHRARCHMYAMATRQLHER
ncbi:MAG: hypothetical protein QOK20_2370, partial [Acidimicrobiaceae bacterium]|nr:hypothetical protein [Acidimicrobiaceae bacterium]